MFEANTPDLISILGDAPSMENLRTLARVRRDYAERMVETLIDALDAIDGDPDLEPWLGSPNVVPERRRDPRWRFGKGIRRTPMADHIAFGQGGTDDREEEDEDEDGADAEPSLGSVGSSFGTALADQRLWACGSDDEREEENEHGGDISDERHDQEADESNLGAPDGRTSQIGWADGSPDERERDDDMEPALGQPEGVYHDQSLWGRIGGAAHEDEEDFRRHPGHREGARLLEVTDG